MKNEDEYIYAAMAQLFMKAQAQFGNAVKSYWFHEADTCPHCSREIDAMDIKGKPGLSLNAYIYRKRGVLIGYFLCGRCAKKVFRDAKRNPGHETELHAAVEETGIKAYHSYMSWQEI
jgi:hypothetical protein